MTEREMTTLPSVGRLGASGVTLLELVLVVAILGLTVGAGALAVRPHGAWHAARAARAFLLWGRLEAIWSGRAVAVMAADPAGLVARAGEGASAVAACGAGEIGSLRFARFGGVTVREALRGGIVWLPGGGARSCAGGGVISGSMVLADGARLVRIVVSSLGRVRLEGSP